MKKYTSVAVSVAVLASLATALCQADEPLSVPRKPDPPLAIDGDPTDWNAVPGKLKLNRVEPVATDGEKRDGAADLSAAVQWCWRDETLYLGVTVSDSQRGEDLGKGDQIELYLDAASETGIADDAFAARQFQLSIRPGTFGDTGDELKDSGPEIQVQLPSGTSAKGAQVAARGNGEGDSYFVEAAIPWTVFGLEPQVAMPLGLEVVVVGSGGETKAAQKEKLSIGTAPWLLSRSRLLPAVLTGTDGSVPAATVATPLFQSESLKPGESKMISFDTPQVPPGYEAIVSLQARLDTPRAGGYTSALAATLNGQAFGIERLINKSASEERANGKTQSMASGESFTVPYAPDYKATDAHDSYRLRHAEAARFEFRVTDLLKQGGNVLEIKSTPRASIKQTLVVANAELIYRLPEEKYVPQGPPDGELPVITPKTADKVQYQIEKGAEDSEFSLQFGGETYRVASQYSTPAGKWASASNDYFSVERRFEERDECIVVRDTFTNLTAENLPLMHRHQVLMPVEKVWLGGLSPSGAEGSSSDPKNPTVFGTSKDAGIGLLPLDDVFQVHIDNYSSREAIGLADKNLVIEAGGTYTAEWAILPIVSADHFDFINATRRLLDSNFQIDGSFAFLRADPRNVGKWSDAEITDFAKYKSVRYLSTSLGYPSYQGRPPHGTAFQLIDHQHWQTAIERRRRLLPDVTQLAYFHCFIDVTDEAPEKYKDARILLTDGTQADYGKDYLKLFVPTLTNAYGPAVADNIDIILDEMKLDGVYWDEMDRSRYSYSYGDPWDGVSADIDSKSMKITRLKSSVTLLSQAWRLQQAQRIMQDGILIANGGLPSTRTMRNLHYPAFVETGSISNCVRTQLYSPIALGDHLTERSEEDAYRIMLKALDYGCVYYWYFDLLVIPTHATLTKYMFPITPIELGNGFLIGEERIVTKRSGVYGWNDRSQHETHVFDASGREVDLETIEAPTVIKSFEKDGKRWTEVRIGEGWSAAIVRDLK